MATPGNEESSVDAEKPALGRDKLQIILVGTEVQASFRVPLETFFTTSKYFTALCSDRWKRPADEVLRLPDIEPRIFNVYCGWQEHEHIDLAYLNLGNTGFPDATEARCDVLIRAYALGDMVLDVNFRDTVVDRVASMVSGGGRISSAANVTTLYDLVPRRSKLALLFVVDWSHRRYGMRIYRDHLSDMPQDFVVEIAMYCIRRQHLHHLPRGPIDNCRYHEHESVEAAALLDTSTALEVAAQKRGIA
ncbi:uncharacterized protein LTR77_010142 [Saxophila tyrrhenica]|uniref:BTB domain-containing protein n=1 Tax=Saxophila tyrrhenica TaxID=1690608 RepID=A0AAV9NWZ4_9PEZI|nr:hypothetical protein LTR77_010142 [Saxophila tyrrhenica]